MPVRELTYNNSRRSMLPREYTKSTNFWERNLALLIAIIASLGAYSIGSCIAWSSNAISSLSTETFPLSFEGMTTRQVSWIVAIFTLGATLSPLLVYKLWRFIGSKIFILMGSGFLLTSWVLLALHENLITILCARLLAGIAAGCLHFLIPVYIQDIASSELRTIIDYIWHTQLAAGIVMQFITGLFGPMQVTNIASGVAPLILLCVFPFMPESPRYLCAKGHSNAAKDILRKFREIDDETEHEVHIWSSKKLAVTSFRTVFKSPSNLRRLLPTFGLVLFDQLIGVWAAFFYLSWNFRIIGDDLDPRYSAIIIAIVFLVSISILKLVRVSFSDRRTLIWSGILMAVVLISVGFLMHYKGSSAHRSNEYEHLPLVGVCILAFLYAIGLCRLSWKYTRILIPKSRYFTVRALCTSMSWCILVIFTRAYPRLVETVGIGWMLWFMALGCIGLSIFTAVFIPDIDNLSAKYMFDDEDAFEQSNEVQP